MRNKIIEIASNEVGYKEGAGNSNKYSNELYGKAQEWCADFVRWCLIKVGAGELFPVSSYVPTIAEWFSEKGKYMNSQAFGGNYIPQKGDIVVFDYNHNRTSDHIGLVERVENGRLYTIEGNKDNMVKRCEYNLSSNEIRAYLTPEYKVINTAIKPVSEIAQEVINGAWGNGEERKARLEEAGYNYEEVQAKVNEMLRPKEIYKTVTAQSGLNIRATASTSGIRIGGVACNEKVQVLEENIYTANGFKWDKIKYNNIIGYVANTYLR